MTLLTKDPDAHLDYGFDWAEKGWLQEGETITASIWTVAPSDTLTASDESFTTTTATVWLTGGTEGATYRVTNQITTTAGRIDDRSLSILVTQR